MVFYWNLEAILAQNYINGYIFFYTTIGYALTNRVLDTFKLLLLKLILFNYISEVQLTS